MTKKNTRAPAREAKTDPAPPPSGVPEPHAAARELRKAEVLAVLRVFREELPALRGANPYRDASELLASIHTRYETELTDITRTEESIDAGKQ